MSSTPSGRHSKVAGKYELLEPLGEGGMASVWRGVTHGAAGFTRKVAIKRVLPELAKDTKFAALFVEEARVVSDLQHPNIVQIHDFDRDARGQYFIVMEWVEGIDLDGYVRAHLEVREYPPWGFVAAVGIEVLRALWVAHRRVAEDGTLAPVIHRDVTPSNILLGVQGVVKLADFGLAKAKDRVSMTIPGTVKGKLSYMAPEIVNGESASVLSDIYGLGIVLWEALAGRRLYRAEGDVQTVLMVREGKVPPLQELRPDLPEDLIGVVHRALSKEPKERFPTALHMQRAIAAILRTHPERTDAEPLGRSVRWAVNARSRKAGKAE